MTRASSPCPYGESLQAKWEQRSIYFSRWEEGMQADPDSFRDAPPEVIAEKYAKIIPGQRIVDAYTGMGTVAIAFASVGKKVIALENVPERLDIARSNAAVYGVADEIDFKVGDLLDKLSSVVADTIYLDPPKKVDPTKEKTFGLDDYAIDGYELLRGSLESVAGVALRVPPNFVGSDLKPFQGSFRGAKKDYFQGKIISNIVFFKGENRNLARWKTE